MVLTPRSSDTQLLRDLGRGGVLFAACWSGGELEPVLAAYGDDALAATP